MPHPINLNGSLLHDEVFRLLAQQSPFALTQWLADTLVDYLKEADDDSRCRLLSFAWAVSVLHNPVELRDVANALASVSSTSDVGVDTALQNLCRARIATAESSLSAHNTHWIRAAQILDSLSEFSTRGLRLAQVRLARMLETGKGNG